MTNASGAAAWTLVDGSAGTRDFRANVSRSSLVDATANDSNASAIRNQEVFAIHVDDGGTLRDVFVYQDGVDDVLVKVYNGSGSLSTACRAPGGADGHVVVDLSNASVGGRSCPPLSFFATVDPGHDVAYDHGGNATGTYSLVVAENVSTVRDGDFAPAGSGGNPRATPAIYAATLRVDYRTRGSCTPRPSGHSRVRTMTEDGRRAGTTDDRALSTLVNYVITLGIVALLGSGLFVTTADVVEDERERAIRSEFDVTGNRLASGIATVDRLATAPEGTTTENASLTVDLPGTVAGSSYLVTVGNRTSDGRHRITLTSTHREVTRRAWVKTATPVEPTTVDGGPVTVVYDADAGTLEVTDGEP